MVGVKLVGGMGNQMFQYAFVTSVATQNKCQFFLDKEGMPIEIYKYFKLKRSVFYYIDRLFFNHKGFGLFFSHYLRNAFYTLIKKSFTNQKITVSNIDNPLESLKLVNDKVFFEGFFQSPLFFKSGIHEVLKSFELKDSIRDLYFKKYQFLRQKKKITIHIRKTDYASLGHLNLGHTDLSLPYAYYHRIIKEIHRDDNYYIFISDDPQSVAAEFHYLTEKYISSDTAIMDFQHMLNSEICIIANSTFSWWAAFLNKNPNKKVFCPRYFLGFYKDFEYPVNIYPADWIQKEAFDKL